MPSVSVIIPCFDCEQYLVECVESVLDQTGVELEIVLVDDASQDGKTPYVIETLSRTRPNIVALFRPSNGGPAAALNSGLLVAQGDFICCFGSDDIMLPGNLVRKVDALLKYPRCGLAFSDAIIIDQSGIEIRRAYANRQTDKVIPKRRAFHALLRRNGIVASSVLMRREMIENLGYLEDLRHGEDWLMWLRISSSNDLYFIGTSLVKYRVREKSLNQRNWETGLDLQCMQRMLDFLQLQLPDNVSFDYRYVYGYNLIRMLGGKVGYVGTENILRAVLESISVRPQLMLTAVWFRLLTKLLVEWLRWLSR